MAHHPSLVFGSPDTPLARSQSQALVERITQVLPRVQCRIEWFESADHDVQEEPFLACDRSGFADLAGLILTGEVRAAVMQAYDLPVPLPEGMAIHCVPDRAIPFDALLNRQGLIMDELDAGSRIGVLCLRARTQLQCQWPQLDFQILPGGVDRAMETHLRKSEIDGLVLPASVTEILGIQGIVSEIFTPEFILPAAGQGTIAIVGSEADADLSGWLAPLHSRASARELQAERAFRRRMVSDMDLPIGVLAHSETGGLAITGTTGCGTNRITVHGAHQEAEAIGGGLAQQLLTRPEAFVELLEADFPQGLPEEDEDEEEGMEILEDLVIAEEEDDSDLI